MNTPGKIKLTQTVCSTLIFLTSISLTYAYPPDNAAVLYYRASLNYNVNNTMEDKLTKLIKGNIDMRLCIDFPPIF